MIRGRLVAYKKVAVPKLGAPNFPGLDGEFGADSSRPRVMLYRTPYMQVEVRVAKAELLITLPLTVMTCPCAPQASV